jgi:acetyl-CoA carboxylase biotin carboxyl carrier protein
LSDDTPRRNFDLAELRRIVTLMRTNELVELELEDAGRRVRLVRAGATPIPLVQGAVHHAAAAPVASPAPAPAAAPGADKAARDTRGAEITSPMVGTFYRAPSPDASPYAEVGDRVRKDTTVCIVEAMKVMNEIKAEVEGEILEILVQNGEPVEFGQPLFLVRPTAGAA